jgi:rare lipoprotein A (peptidoglycan hydrolase)
MTYKDLGILVISQKSAAQGSTDPITLTGNASFYFPKPSGESACKPFGYPYTDSNGFTAAVRNSGANGQFPCGSTADVTYRPLGSNVPRTVTVKIIDSGPYVKGRVIDLSPGAFSALAGPDVSKGVIPVTVKFPAGPQPPLKE